MDIKQMREYLDYCGELAAKFIRYTYVDKDEKGNLEAKTALDIYAMLYAKLTGEEESDIKQRWICKAAADIEDTRKRLAEKGEYFRY